MTPIEKYRYEYQKLKMMLKLGMKSHIFDEAMGDLDLDLKEAQEICSHSNFRLLPVGHYCYNMGSDQRYKKECNLCAAGFE